MNLLLFKLLLSLVKVHVHWQLDALGNAGLAIDHFYWHCACSFRTCVS